VPADEAIKYDVIRLDRNLRVHCIMPVERPIRHELMINWVRSTSALGQKAEILEQVRSAMHPKANIRGSSLRLRQSGLFSLRFTPP